MGAEKFKKQGFQAVTVWLSPDAIAKLEAIEKQQGYLHHSEAVRWAVDKVATT